MIELIDPKVFRLELDKMDCIDKFGYVILPITKLNAVLERSVVEAVPVVYGEWWPAKDGYYGHVMCSACHGIESHKTDFCPNCGVKMTKDKVNCKDD